MTDILKIQQNMSAIFTAEDSKERRVRRLTGDCVVIGYVTDMPRAWSQSFPSEDKKHVCHLNPPHMVLVFWGELSTSSIDLTDVASNVNPPCLHLTYCCYTSAARPGKNLTKNVRSHH